MIKDQIQQEQVPKLTYKPTRKFTCPLKRDLKKKGHFIEPNHQFSGGYVSFQGVELIITVKNSYTAVHKIQCHVMISISIPDTQSMVYLPT